MSHVPLGLNRAAISFVIVCSLLLPSRAYSQLTETIGYQGFLTDASGTPINVTVNLTFRFYDALIGGTQLWTETVNGAPVTDGIFSVQLGSVTSFRSSNLGFDRPYFLSIQVNADPEMSPRLPLSGVPAALVAGLRQAEVSVNCGTETIADAIATAPVGGRLVVNLVGNCIGNLTIDRDKVTLRGGTITGVTPHTNPDVNAVIWINGARGFELDGVTLQGAAGDATSITGLLLSDNASAMVVNGSSILNHNGRGIHLVESSNLDLFNSVVQGNAGIGVFIDQNSHFDARDNARVENNGDDGVYVRLSSSATFENTTVQNNGDPADSNLWANGIFVDDGSAVRLIGGNTIQTPMPHGNVGSAIAAYRNSVVRIRGVNTIEAPPALDFDPRNYCSFCPAAGGMAMDIEMNSAVRQERAKTTITGWIESFNGSTVDLRDTVLTGHLEASLSSNFRLRDQTPGDGATIIGNIVLRGTSELSIHAGSNDERAIIDGNVICFNNFGVRSDIQFNDPNDGYINCSGVPTDVSISITEPSDPVIVNTLGVHTLTINNTSTNPTVEAVNVSVNSNFSGVGVTLGTITVTPAAGTNCTPFGNGFNCFLGNIAPGATVNIDVEVTPISTGTLLHNAGAVLNNFDPNFSDNNAFESTTVQ